MGDGILKFRMVLCVLLSIALLNTASAAGEGGGGEGGKSSSGSGSSGGDGKSSGGSPQIYPWMKRVHLGQSK